MRAGACTLEGMAEKALRPGESTGVPGLDGPLRFFLNEAGSGGGAISPTGAAAGDEVAETAGDWAALAERWWNRVP